ncbi:hypothetical protein CASFOL_039373 [Castilleja foliolosa]|uniref:Uncharacterized protein n=1 Tax=Castilleja foliolosa TaxID=1961234 RepID=A0ABD3BIB2_9LAMI
MGAESLRLIQKSKFKTDLLEIESQDPKLHVLFIPDNPGVISFYTDFLESLYELLGGNASFWMLIAFLLSNGEAIRHISHSDKDWESGRLFSLHEQIDHKGLKAGQIRAGLAD